ncbi:hypothetical protein DFH29DRAFT_1005434 [Suillus ampliporus]|nr:hypothetical protein DFH29DRAFT_1005434 [Suillus ampliporus]
MAPAEHSKTIDFGIKLASLMSAPHVSDVPKLDKLTDLELNHLIIEEEEPASADQPLSHMLLWIFRTFTLEVLDVTELQSMVLLYDKENCRWNWALPKLHWKSGIIQLPDLEEGGDGEENSGANKESGSRGTGKGHQLKSTLWSPKLHTLEDIFSSFFNATCGAVAWRKWNEIMAANSATVVCTWSACNSTCPIKDQEVSRKPDLALLDDVEAQWDTIKAVCELMLQLYTTTGIIGKMIDSKAYLLLRCQPWRCFVLLLSLTHEYRELRVHMYDHAGGVVTPPIHIDSSKIAVEDHRILHHDCSLNNAMIEDDGDGTHGLLIDWEFAVHIDPGQKCAIGGTGTLPFMSHSLLWQLSEAVGDPATSARSWKAKVATSSLAKLPPLILHHYHDDLKSLFYIFVCICIEFRGPLRVRRNLLADKSQDWLPHLWSANTYSAGSDVKTLFFFSPQRAQTQETIPPLFQDTTPTCDAMEVLDLLEMHLAKLPKDEPSPELLFAKRVIAALPKKRQASDSEGDDWDDWDDHLNKPECNMIHGQMGWTMEVAPQPKRSRTT